MIVVAILFYNKPTLTRTCVESCLSALARLSHHDREKFSVVLVDNGSDPTCTTALFSLFGSNASFTALSSNTGFTGGMNHALNTGFLSMQTEWVALCSNDIEFSEDFFIQLLSDMPESSEQGLILCPQIRFVKAREKVSYFYGKVCVESFELTHVAKPKTNPEIIFPDYYPAALTLWNRKAYETLKGFTEEYFCYWEDVDLSLRATEKNIILKSCPKLYAHHLGRGTTKKKKQYSELFFKNKERFKNKLTKKTDYPSAHP